MDDLCQEPGKLPNRGLECELHPKSHRCNTGLTSRYTLFRSAKRDNTRRNATVTSPAIHLMSLTVSATANLVTCSEKHIKPRF